MTSKKHNLTVAFCSYQAAKFAVTHWHYSRSMPIGKIVKVGVWENQKYIGVVMYSRGANNNIGKPYKLDQTKVCELTRVALTKHLSPVSQILSLSQKLLKETSPGLRLIVSYADTDQEHTGVIYQANNWVYTGFSKNSTSLYLINGKQVHMRVASSTLGSIKGIKGNKTGKKHKYLFPLDKAMRRQISELAKPYPKHADVGKMESRIISSD